MNEGVTLDLLDQSLNLLKKMYDAVRIVDPVCKQVLDWGNCAAGEARTICYKYWMSGEICENCISLRAYYENKSFVKLEQGPEFLFVVTAVPLEMDGQPLVLELIKNATDQIILGYGDYNEGHTMQHTVSEINDLIIRDSLTSLYNRRFINSRLPVDISNAAINNSPVSLFLLDLDNLKEINDHFGHVVGDQVLKMVAEMLGKNIRSENGWVARYGGDEFLICLNNTGSSEAYDIAELIRSSIEKININYRDKQIPLTISIGLHTTQDPEMTAEKFINYADHKLYTAKRNGKNRIVIQDDTELADIELLKKEG